MPAITTYAPLKKNRVYPVSAWVYFNRNSAHYLLVGDQKGHVLAWKWSPDDKACDAELQLGLEITDTVS